jgi:hypothetical protein
MIETVVDLLKSIHVNKDHGRATTVASRQLPQSTCLFIKPAAVHECG